MNYYKDTSDYIKGYNPIITDTRIPDDYNPDNELDYLLIIVDQDYIDNQNDDN